MVSDFETRPDKYVAAKYAALLGRTLQIDLGSKILEKIVSGLSVPETVAELRIAERYQHCSYQVCLDGTRKALRGHNQGFGVENYKGLLSPKQREKIYGKNLLRRAVYSFEEGLGIHGLSKKTRIKNSSKAGKVAKELKKGIHGLTEEQNSANRLAAAEARGAVLWSNEEREEANKLALTKKYRRGPFTDCVKLADYLDKKYHDGMGVRTSLTVSQALRTDRFKSKKQDL